MVEFQVFVGCNPKWGGESAAIAGQVPGPGEGNDDEVGIRDLVDLVESFTHGGDVGPTRKSGEMSVKDGDERTAVALSRAPDISRVIDQLDVRQDVSD
jgi:hypothetical protein